MRSRPVSAWKDYNVTARDLVADGSITADFSCEGCRRIVEFSIWKLGARLADTPIQRMRFRCSMCGLYPSSLRIGRRTSGKGETILTISLNPACWDGEHETKQRNAKARAEAAWKAKGGR
ncbi:hypothetical protein [Brevundimonas sp. Marseille-Q4549]